MVFPSHLKLLRKSSSKDLVYNRDRIAIANATAGSWTLRWLWLAADTWIAACACHWTNQDQYHHCKNHFHHKKPPFVKNRNNSL
jgi:hypothetical protein